MKNLVIIVLLFLYSSIAIGSKTENTRSPEIKPMPKNVKDKHDDLKNKLKPSVKNWVGQQGKNAVSDNAKESDIKQLIKSRFNGQNLKDEDLNRMMFLVMTERSKTLEEFLKERTQKLQNTQNELKKLNEKIKNTKPGSDRDKLKNEIEKLQSQNQKEIIMIQNSMKKRDQAFEAITTLMKKFSETQKSIISNMK